MENFGSLPRCSNNWLRRRKPLLTSTRKEAGHRNLAGFSVAIQPTINDQRLSTSDQPMREAVVVASSRTGLAKSFRGSFNMTRPEELAAHCIKDVLRKTPKLDPAEIDDVVMGCAQPHGAQGDNVARVAAMLAGLPVTVA